MKLSVLAAIVALTAAPALAQNTNNPTGSQNEQSAPAQSANPGAGNPNNTNPDRSGTSGMSQGQRGAMEQRQGPAATGHQPNPPQTAPAPR
jgi:hypothetical protein